MAREVAANQHIDARQSLLLRRATGLKAEGGRRACKSAKQESESSSQGGS